MPPNSSTAVATTRLPVVGLSDVEMEITRFSPNVFGDRFAFGIQDVTKDHLGSLGDESPHMGCAHPARPAADDSDLARQPTCHRVLLLQ